MVTRCDLAVSRAWDVVVLFSTCLCAVAVDIAMVAENSLSAC